MLSNKARQGARYFQMLDDADTLDLLNWVIDPDVYEAMRGLVETNTRSMGVSTNRDLMLKHAIVVATAWSLRTAEVYHHRIDDALESELLIEQMKPIRDAA